MKTLTEYKKFINMIYTVPQKHHFSGILLLLQKTNCAPIDLIQQLIFKSTIFNLQRDKTTKLFVSQKYTNLNTEGTIISYF